VALISRLVGSAAAGSSWAESATPEAKRPDAKQTPPGVVGAKAAAALLMGSGAEALPAEAGSSTAESATPVAKRPDVKQTPPGVVGAKAEAGLMGPPPPRDSQRGERHLHVYIYRQTLAHYN
jgi:hypothetical protein